MGKHNKRWGRLNEFNEFVEFTFEDPKGRFHKDIIWLEVDMTTPYRAKLTSLGTIEDPVPILDLSSVLLEERLIQAEKDATEAEDNDALLHKHWVESQEASKKDPNPYNAVVDVDYFKPLG